MSGAQPISTYVACANLVLPLAAAGPLDDVTRELYEVLGVSTTEIVHKKAHYTVLAGHLADAIAAIDSSLAPGGPALPAHTRAVPVADASVPVHQPRVSGATAAILEALGVETVDIVAGGEVRTVVASRVACAAGWFAPARAAGPPPARAGPAPTHTFAVGGVHLKDFYEGEPPRAVQVIAKAFGARFLRVQSGAGALYWVLCGQAPSLDATLQRLGLYA